MSSAKESPGHPPGGRRRLPGGFLLICRQQRRQHTWKLARARGSARCVTPTTGCAPGFARLRVGEHAVHTWDVVVALDPAATLAPDAVALLIDALEQVAARSAKPDGKQRTVRVSTTDPERQFILTTDDEVTLTPSDQGATRELGLSELRLPAEALIRLVYGRLDEAHTPPTETAGVELDDLRQIFRGF
jgi:hypothetical protein